jgi:hypothetical protein
LTGKQGVITFIGRDHVFDSTELTWVLPAQPVVEAFPVLAELDAALLGGHEQGHQFRG